MHAAMHPVRQLTRSEARPGSAVEVYANNWKLFGLLVSWTPAEITVKSGRKTLTRPAREINTVCRLG
jgi:hypothetical protein